MLFNTWFGQMRPSSTNGSNVPYITKLQSISNQFKGEARVTADAQGAGGYTYRAKRAMGTLMVRDLTPKAKRGESFKAQSVKYTVDNRGNMDVVAPEHILGFAGLGYPVYNGLFIEDIVCPRERFISCPRESFLLWPDNPEYDRRIMEGLSKAKEETHA